MERPLQNLLTFSEEDGVRGCFHPSLTTLNSKDWHRIEFTPA